MVLGRLLTVAVHILAAAGAEESEPLAKPVV